MAWLTTLPWGQLLINGIALGSLYALTAFGIVLIYKTTDVLTFGQGEMAMFSAFIAFTLLDRLKLPFPVAFVLTLVFALALGALVERVLMRRAQQGSVLNSIIVTIGLALVLVGTAGFVWGYEVRPFPDPVIRPTTTPFTPASASSRTIRSAQSAGTAASSPPEVWASLSRS